MSVKYLFEWHLNEMNKITFLCKNRRYHNFFRFHLIDKKIYYFSQAEFELRATNIFKTLTDGSSVFPI